jgi:flagellar biosynthetic protein FliR
MSFRWDEALLLFLPAFFRVGGILLAGPFWSHVQVPYQITTGAALLVTVAMWPVVSAAPVPPVDGLFALGLLVAKELAVGLVLGVAANLIFFGVEFAGQMVGITMGLAIVNVLDPIYNSSMSVVSRLYGLFALAIFFALDGHHILFEAIAASFRVVPLGAVHFGPGVYTKMMEMAYGVFVIGVHLAAPALAVLLLAEVAMGLVARTVPQMNVFLVGFPLKIGLGFAMMAATLPLVMRVLEGLFRGLGRDLGILLRGM